LWQLANDVLTGVAACALLLAAIDVMDVRYALPLAGVLVAIGLLLEDSTAAA
jgi:hypothetical protein